MNAEEFWRLLEETNRAAGGNVDDQGGLLKARLEALTPSEVSDFRDCLYDAMMQAGHWSIQCAAWIVGCGESDDGFADFRAWIVAHGQEFLRRVIESPDTLATVPCRDDPLEDWHFGFLLDLPSMVYESATGAHLSQPYELCGEADLLGEECDWSVSALRMRLPLLWEKYGNRDSLMDFFKVPDWDSL